MKAFELFEFQDYLTKDDFKKVESIFIYQCINKKFTEFNTSLGSNSKDYLSYLVAASLIDQTIENNGEGYLKFFNIANGFSERFFQNTIYHVYNLSIIQEKEKVFNDLMNIGLDILYKNKKIFEFRDYQLQDNIKEVINEINMSNNGNAVYLLEDYQQYYKKLQSYLLNNSLKKELPINSIDKPKNKI
jgi:hypothetical protein